VNSQTLFFVLPSSAYPPTAETPTVCPSEIVFLILILPPHPSSCVPISRPLSNVLKQPHKNIFTAPCKEQCTLSFFSNPCSLRWCFLGPIFPLSYPHRSCVFPEFLFHSPPIQIKIMLIFWGSFIPYEYDGIAYF